MTAHLDMDVMDTVALMTSHRLRRLVVTNDTGHLSGIVTIENVLELLTRELAELQSS